MDTRNIRLLKFYSEREMERERERERERDEYIETHRKDKIN